MALLDSEIARIKFELGFNLLSIGAEPMIGIARVFEQVIQPYMTAGASTTSSTAVAVATTPTLATLTLAAATGFAAGATVIVDVGSRQESAVCQSLTGSTISLLLLNAHSGTYPVTVEGGEAIVRAILQKLQRISGLGTASGGDLDTTALSAGIKKVDEIEFLGAADGAGFKNMVEVQAYWRAQLASALGIGSLWEQRKGAGATVSMY